MTNDITTQAGETAPASPGERKNVLFITCDQWRGDSLSAVGHPTVRTPNIDALAAQGVLFTRHYAGAAPCSPARACLYTGLYQMTNRVCRNGTPLSARFENIASIARKFGYDPTLFGYTDVSPDPNLYDPADPVLRSYEGVLPGFTVRQLLPEHQKPWLSWLASRGVDSRAGYPLIHRSTGSRPLEVSNGVPVYSRDETPTAFLADEYIRWLSEQDGARPWFAHISFLNPHPPFIVPDPFNEMYDPTDGPAFRRQENWQAEAKTHPWLSYQFARQRKSNFIAGAIGLVREWNEAAFRTIRSIYYGMISEVDQQLGRIWEALRAANMWDDTIIVLTSDHAEMMGDHFMLGKGGYFDQSYHVPLIIRDPASSGGMGAKVDRFTEAVDILPTIIELIGGAPPIHLDGHSLTQFLAGKPAQDWRDCAHWEFDFRGIRDQDAERHFGITSQQCNLAVARSDQYKYVHFGGGMPPLLFNMRDDPGELDNLANDPAHLATRIAFAEQMLDWRGRHLDQALAMVELMQDGAFGFEQRTKKPAPAKARA